MNVEDSQGSVPEMLRRVAARHTEARREVEHSRAELDEAILAALDSGCSESAVARTSGLSRITVRRVQGKPVSRSPWPRVASR